ncbi:phosphate/phosphite/phosphonate ABC transporter substrate-binding protein [Lactobacillus helveticus]|uniref:Phosphonate ABC superfamily ATP binding cassette transporter, binding protein n=3 Tax=Lactobacillus helveticus TaxID=1587 RepID=U6FB94_LACHE|nr:phosphate/phosphite/phosphonate ABC transporter substrate-binding protein [Lactobacillus helveticus]AUJ27049.1 phosphate ABC transporter substrate-binding protein [Lactobacillus helveticus]AZA22527.1 MAG: phosphate/phosphite/phosphonate ABC transporter substrate-binding protein [Lactobacillus helveticus]KXN79223.1 phosphate ABC transporter substrate-binding protein [Lactobacillus helveticus]MCT3402286.1 phosphate/phosphite/phosphonate ABC transporter substrate-binding protein [Lactobacillus 
MKIKKVLVGAFAVLAALSLSACSGNKKSSSSTNEPKELNVEFVPSTQANKMEAKAKPLGMLLQKQLHIPVHVTVSTDFSGLVEAMSSKKVDVGFMPPYSYMLAHKRGIADVLLQAERYGYDEPSGKMNHKLMHKYRGMIVVKKGSKIKSWKDLKGKKIAIGDPSSSSGYVYPIAELYKKGLNVTKESKLVNITSDDQKVISVLNGDVDAAFVFSDARDIAAKDDKRAMTDVVPIYFTQWIPNDTISVRKDMPKKFRVKLAKAFKNIAKSKKGKQIIESIYSHYGYVDAKDSDFDGLRNYQKIVNEATGK